jgi:isopenicillin-N epimerase
MDLIDRVDWIERMDGMKTGECPPFDKALLDLLHRPRRVDSDADWADLAALWDIRADTTYLNHGSFGPSPSPVRAARSWWQDRCEEQPMDFFLRWLEPALESARRELARFCGTTTDNLVFADNATWAMNVVARSFPLGTGDEILLTDHEYGAVFRIWNEACARAGASSVTAVLPMPFTAADHVVDAIVSAITPRTRLVVVSHIANGNHFARRCDFTRGP